MPVAIDKVHAFLRAMASGGTVKEGVSTGEGLLKKAYEVLIHRGLELHVIPKLPVHAF